MDRNSIRNNINELLKDYDRIRLKVNKQIDILESLHLVHNKNEVSPSNFALLTFLCGVIVGSGLFYLITKGGGVSNYGFIWG